MLIQHTDINDNYPKWLIVIGNVAKPAAAPAITRTLMTRVWFSSADEGIEHVSNYKLNRLQMQVLPKTRTNGSHSIAGK